MASEADLVPAAPVEGARSLQNLIKFPDTEGDLMLIVRCDARLSRVGQVETNQCFMEDNSKSAFERAIAAAAFRAKFTPAQRDGRRVPVYYQFSVVFEKRNDLKTITVYPYHVLSTEQVGVLDTGPQRYASSSRWKGCSSGILLWISMTVDEQGIPRDVGILGEGDHGRCGEMLIKLAASGEFIPAMRDGRRVTVTYTELYWSPDMGRDPSGAVQYRPRPVKGKVF
jgi:hypothetical protein